MPSSAFFLTRAAGPQGMSQRARTTSVLLCAVLVAALGLPRASSSGGASEQDGALEEAGGSDESRSAPSGSQGERMLFTDSEHFSSEDRLRGMKASDTLSAAAAEDGDEDAWVAQESGPAIDSELAVTVEGANTGPGAGEQARALAPPDSAGNATAGNATAGVARKLGRRKPQGRQPEDEAAKVDAELQRRLDQRLEEQALGPVENISMVELVVDMGVLTEQQLIDGVEIPPIEWQRHLQQQRLLLRHRRLWGGKGGGKRACDLCEPGRVAAGRAGSQRAPTAVKKEGGLRSDGKREGGGGTERIALIPFA